MSLSRELNYFMKEINFLNKLIKQGKLGLVEQSDEIKASYLKKSESNLSSSKMLFENNKLEESIYLTYYSMYNSLLALLFAVGIKSENHSASIFLLKDIFEIDNSDILKAKKDRIQAQYYVDFKIKKQEAKELISISENFNDKLLDFTSKLTNEKTDFYRNKFIKLLNINT